MIGCLASSSGLSISPSRRGFLMAVSGGTLLPLPLSLLCPSSYAALIAALIFSIVLTSVLGMIRLTEYFGVPHHFGGISKF